MHGRKTPSGRLREFRKINHRLIDNRLQVCYNKAITET